MSKELKAPDKVTQKMTRDGAIAENLTTGETSSMKSAADILRAAATLCPGVSGI